MFTLPKIPSCFKAAAMLAMSIPALMTGAPAFAGSSTGSLVVSASILPSCTVVGSTLAFGTYSSAQIDQTGSLSVLCTNGTTYTIALSAGGGTGATTTIRVMTGSLGGTLNYQLFRDSARTLTWGSIIGTDTLANTGTGTQQTITVYGRILANQTPLAGVYTDTVLVTLTY